MKQTEDSIIINKGQDSTAKIKEYFPDFYASNKTRIVEGKIKFFEEPWAIEGGVLIDLETFETLFVDFRA